MRACVSPQQCCAASICSFRKGLRTLSSYWTMAAYGGCGPPSRARVVAAPKRSKHQQSLAPLAPPPRPSEPPQMDSFLRRFAFCVPLLITLNDHFVSVKCVEGESMQPTLNPEESLGVSDYVLIAKWNDSAPYRRGEIVALRCVPRRSISCA